MYNRQTKDNKQWCDLANLTNVYNSDNIHHHYMIDNKVGRIASPDVVIELIANTMQYVVTSTYVLLINLLLVLFSTLLVTVSEIYLMLNQ